MSKQGGFTVPELIIVSTLTAVFSTMLLQFAIGSWQVGYKIQADSETFSERLNASDYFREILGTASGLTNQNSIPDPNVPPSAQDPVAGNQYWITIHAEPGSFGNNSSITPLLYFRRPSLDASKNIIMNNLIPYEDEFIVYHDGPLRQLKVRTLANPSATGNAAKTSCPEALATTSCPADKILINYLSSIELVYFSRAGTYIDYTPNPPSYDSEGALIKGPDFPAVEVVEIKLRVLRGSLHNGSTSTSSATVIRIALRNN